MHLQDSGSMPVFKVTTRVKGQFKGPWLVGGGAFVTYCNISCFFLNLDHKEKVNNWSPRKKYN